LFPGLGVGPTVQLLVGLRKSRVVMGGPWLAGLLQGSEQAAAAATLHPQVCEGCLRGKGGGCGEAGER
jgi:hypothetical protein